VIQVFATREGLTGQKTATGWRIADVVPFVALPSDAALRLWVLVRKGDISIRALVLDVGPHYAHDHAYVFGGARPRAEALGHDDYGRVVTNPAGIDLGEAVWQALGMSDNGPVEWEFL
jgi:hypothetical protein